jgi:hypothetical protein
VSSVCMRPTRMWSRLWLLFFAAGLAAQARDEHQEVSRKLVSAAAERTHHQVRYVSDYVRMGYPG